MIWRVILVTTAKKIYDKLRGLSLEINRLGQDYDNEIKRHANQIQAINNSYQISYNTAVKNAQNKKVQNKKKHEDYKKQVNDHLNNLSKLESELKNRGYKKRKNIQANSSEKLGADEANDILNKISESGFWPSFKKTLSIGGYKLNLIMAKDLYRKIEGTRLYLSECLATSEEYMVSQNNLAEKGLRDTQNALETSRITDTNKENAKHNNIILGLRRRAQVLRQDNRILEVDKLIKTLYQICGYSDTTWNHYSRPTKIANEYIIGQINLPTGITSVNHIQSEILSKINSYNREQNGFLIPYSQSTNSPLLMYFETDASDVHTQSEIFRCIISRLFQFMPLYSNRIIYIDPVGRGISLQKLSHIRNVENKGVCTLYLNTQDISMRLKALTEHIDKTCDILTREGINTVYEHNCQRSKAKIPYYTIVINDYPKGFDAQSLSYMEVLLDKAEQCGISILISHKKCDALENKAYDLIRSFMGKLTCVASNNQVCVLSKGNRSFGFFPLINNIPTIFYDEINEALHYVKPVENKFDKVFGIDKVSYDKSAENGLVIPIAVNNKGKIQELTLDSTRKTFAYITGSVGAGKTVLLHTIIMSSIANYHPDELEVWLFDFKNTEFAAYVTHCAPHFRYISAFKSVEIAFDLINLIEEEYNRRINLFKKILVRDYNSYLKCGKKLPRILIVIDEFHNVVNALKEDTDYERRFINILKEVRHAGFHIIFSDQEASFPKIQDEMDSAISVRIAMANNNESRIIDTLLAQGAKSKELSELIKKAANFKPGEMIFKCPGYGKFEYIECRALYFDSEEKKYQLIENIKKKVGTYSRAHDSFIENRPRKMDPRVIEQFEKYYPCHSDAERYYIGTPMGLRSSYFFEIENTPANNILMVGGDHTKLLSIFRSISKCAYRNNREVVLLVYNRSNIFENNKEFFKKMGYVNIIDTFPQICQFIGLTANEIKRIDDDEKFDFRSVPKKMVVFIGLEKLYRKMNDSLLTQEQAWQIESVDSQEESHFHPEKQSNKGFDVNDPAIRQERQKKRGKIINGNKELTADKSTSALDENIDRIARMRKLLEEKNNENSIPESFAGNSPNQIKGYRALDDLKLMLHEGYNVNCCSMVILERSSELRQMKTYVNYEFDFCHRIALKMSPDSAQVFMSRTTQMKWLNDSSDSNTAIYSFNNGREQCFRPYII